MYYIQSINLANKFNIGNITLVFVWFVFSCRNMLVELFFSLWEFLIFQGLFVWLILVFHVFLSYANLLISSSFTVIHIPCFLISSLHSLLMRRVVDWACILLLQNLLIIHHFRFLQYLLSFHTLPLILLYQFLFFSDYSIHIFF